MKELDKILKYQEIDITLRKILDAINKSDDNKKMEQVRHEFNHAKQQVIDCEKEAEAINAFYQEAEEQFLQESKKMEELELILENNEDEAEIASLIEKLDKLRRKIVELDKKIADRKNAANRIITEYRNAGERGRKLRDMHNSLKAKIEGLRKEKEQEISLLSEQLKALEPSIDKDLIEKYNALTSEGKYPAVVEAYADSGTFSCRGCGLALSQKNSSELVEKGICRCETCRRIIYKQ